MTVIKKEVVERFYSTIYSHMIFMKIRKMIAGFCALLMLMLNNGFAEAISEATWDHIVDVIALDGCTLGLRSDGRVVFAGADLYDYGLKQTKQWTDIKRLEMKRRSLFGFRKDGTIVTTDDYDLRDWTNIVSIEVFGSGQYVAGLHSDGTVSVAAKGGAELEDKFADIKNWYNIKQIVCPFVVDEGLIGLRYDGTVVITDGEYLNREYLNYYWGENWDDEPVEQLVDTMFAVTGIKMNGTVFGFDQEEFYNIESICANIFDYKIYGLRRDNTVAVTGFDLYDQRAADIHSWRDIKKLYLYEEIPIGLRFDGTVASVSGYTDDHFGDWDISAWEGVEDVFLDNHSLIGLKKDGTLYVTGGLFGTRDDLASVKEWSGISKIIISENHIVGLKNDGTVVAAGDNTYGQCNVTYFNGIIVVPFKAEAVQNYSVTTQHFPLKETLK